MKQRILVTGAGGQLAAALISVYASDTDVVPFAHADLDITNFAAVERAVASVRPTAIFNCAAYNLVDRAETDQQTALEVNAFGVRVLARAAAAVDAVIVHYSTDFVFDGRATQPYTEEDAPNPVSVYGSSKLVGEWFALGAPKGFVLRVASLFGGERAKSSVDRIVNALIEHRDAQVFTDRTATPSYVIDVAAATRALVDRGAPGLYHCVGSNHCTWYELAREAARLLGVEENRLIPVPASSVPMAAARPRFAALSNAKLRRIFDMPTWQDALARYVTEVLHRRAAQPSRQ